VTNRDVPSRGAGGHPCFVRRYVGETLTAFSWFPTTAIGDVDDEEEITMQSTKQRLAAAGIVLSAVGATVLGGAAVASAAPAPSAPSVADVAGAAQSIPATVDSTGAEGTADGAIAFSMNPDGSITQADVATATTAP